MRIGLVLPDGMVLGGVTLWSITMANALAELGCDVSLLEHVKQEYAWSEPISPKVRLIRHYGALPYYATLADVTGYVGFYQQALPGVLIPNYGAATFAACAVLSRQHATSIRVIAFAHTDAEDYYDLLDYYEPIIHSFVAVSNEVEHRLVQRIPHRAEDIVTRPYGVHSPPTLQRKWTPANQSLKLVYAGRLVEPQKRISDLARLAKILTAAGVDFQLEIIGDGLDKPKLAASLVNISPTRVRMLSRLPHAQMLQKWQAADVCILVSEYEGTSLAMLEAMAAGCVPVVTAVSGTASTITSGVNGYLVPVGDMESMAKIIRRLATNRDHLASLGENAFHTAKRDFSFHDYVDRFLSLTERIEAQPARSWPNTRPILPPQPPPSLLRRTRHLGKRALRRLYAVVNPR